MRPFLIGAVLLAGCAAGSGDLAGDASLDGDWLELDLATGAVSGVAAPDGLALTRSRWRTTHVLFRRVPGTAAPAVDSTRLPGGGESEDQRPPASHATAFLAVFELTASQWSLLGGGTDRATSVPATGLAPAEIVEAMGARPARRMRLDLPDAALWTAACAAGTTTLFSWGDGVSAEAASTYAVHQPDNGGGPAGPQTVGSRTANALGLFDMHGNAWEIVRSAGGFVARGGAWDSPALQCRTMNEVAIDAGTGHPAVGVRLALYP